MFPQNNSLLCIEPTNNIFEDFSNNIIPSSKLLEDPYTSSSSFCLPLSPLIYNEIDHGFLSHPDLSVIQHILKVNTNPQLTPNTALSSLKENNKTGSNKDQENVNGIVEDCKKNKKGNMKGSAKSTQRRRSSKRDRHSKIKTVHGLRDRRMRLSLEVARPFFRLQDVLGFDKGSKTVEWLLLKASPFIEELIRGQEGLTVGFAKSSSTSECEVESTIDEPVATPKAKGSSDHKKSTRQKRENPKESRKEARARARMRTMAKKIIERLNFDPKLGFEAGEESGTGTLSFNNNNNNNNNEENAFGVGDEVTCWSSLAANPGNWSSLNNFSSQHSDDVLHVCQVAGIHYNGTTSWEAHSNQNQC